VNSLLNPHRPPVFCPGCSHERSLKSLDRAFKKMGLTASEVVVVSDIGCSGLFDTFFNSHAMHGLHGRAVTYAAGIKLARPHLKVVVTMGDGGLGIGGAHILAACRRNLDLTLIILNNFNFGMTGGQFSCTTPQQASVASGFLNRIERPMDICSVAAAAGAPFLARHSAYQKGLAEILAEAISFDGFALVDTWGICPGRYGKRNAITARDIEAAIGELPPLHGPVSMNLRPEYSTQYRKTAESGVVNLDWQGIEKLFTPSVKTLKEVLLLGSAGEGVISAGSLLAHSAVLAGMYVTQKNDYNITVMRGPSVTELIISPEPITYTGVEQPGIIVALSQEGVTRRQDLFEKMTSGGLVILSKGVEIPVTAGRIRELDFRAHGIKKREKALAALSVLAKQQDPITPEMLESAVRQRFQGERLKASLALLERIETL